MRKIDPAGILGLLFLAITAFVLVNFIYPDITPLKNADPGKTSFMEYRERQWERERKKRKIQQKWVPLSQISPYLIKAVLIAEDDKFWGHDGFDREALELAMLKNIKEGRFVSGGSTITQQLAKNLYLTPSKNPLRKMREAFLTMRLESLLSKRRILELYLNVAEWGDGIFGIESASRYYYGKSATELDPLEASRLSVVLPNPIRYNPRSTSRYVENRSKIIYDIMVKRGIIFPSYENSGDESTD